MKPDLKDIKLPTEQLKICYVGNFHRNSVGEPEIANSLEELGHKVFRLHEYTTNLEEIKKTIEENSCDLFLFAKLRVPRISTDFLKSLPCRSICWVFDYYFCEE